MYDISILIANYNSSDLIRETLLSLLECDLNNDCVSIIDNESDDGSFELARNILGDFKAKTVFIREKDHGIYDAINKGIKSTNSRYVVILHAGDTIKFQSYNLLKKIINQDKKNKVSSCILFMKAMIRVKNEVKIYKTNLKEIRYKMALVHSNVVLSRKLHEKYGLYDSSFKIAGDFFLIRKILTSGEKILQIDLPFIVTDYKGISGKLSSLPYFIIEGLKILNNSKFSRIEYTKNLFEIIKSVLFIIKKKFF